MNIWGQQESTEGIDIPAPDGVRRDEFLFRPSNRLYPSPDSPMEPLLLQWEIDVARLDAIANPALRSYAAEQLRIVSAYAMASRNSGPLLVVGLLALLGLPLLLSLAYSGYGTGVTVVAVMTIVLIVAGFIQLAREDDLLKVIPSNARTRQRFADRLVHCLLDNSPSGQQPVALLSAQLQQRPDRNVVAALEAFRLACVSDPLMYIGNPVPQLGFGSQSGNHEIALSRLAVLQFLSALTVEGEYRAGDGNPAMPE
ncbi:MAG: hypothetical protein H7A35_01770 [Planctomycetales bacterium]|nr:hypothetical protein [bacterium]UNM08786.1 MAG: hypothetical protein H7A35_01770 [Planctomycetales bacterium]